MLEIIGFIVLVIIGIFLLIYSYLCLVVGGAIGENVGGINPPLSERISMWIFILLTITYWYWIYSISPFEIILK